MCWPLEPDGQLGARGRGTFGSDTPYTPIRRPGLVDVDSLGISARTAHVPPAVLGSPRRRRPGLFISSGTGTHLASRFTPQHHITLSHIASLFISALLVRTSSRLKRRRRRRRRCRTARRPASTSSSPSSCRRSGSSSSSAAGPSSGSASSSPSSATSPASSTPSGPSPSRRRTTTPLFKVTSDLVRVVPSCPLAATSVVYLRCNLFFFLSLSFDFSSFFGWMVRTVLGVTLSGRAVPQPQSQRDRYHCLLRPLKAHLVREQAQLAQSSSQSHSHLACSASHPQVASPLAAYLDLLWSFHRSPLLSTLPPGLSPSSSDPYAVNRPGSACVAGRQEVKAEEEEEDVGRRHGDLHRHHPRHHPAAAWGLLQVRLRGRVLDLPHPHLLRLPPRHHLRRLGHHQVEEGPAVR